MVNSLNSWISYYPPFLYIFPSFQETHWMYGSFIFFKPKKIQQIPNCHVPSSFLPLLTPYRFFYPSQNPWRIHPKSMRIHHLHTPTDPLVAGKKNQPAWHVITPSTSQASMLQPHRTTIFGEAPQVIQGWHTHTHIRLPGEFGGWVPLFGKVTSKNIKNTQEILDDEMGLGLRGGC